jgi:electron transfer flavoprotein alpha subunit
VGVYRPAAWAVALRDLLTEAAIVVLPCSADGRDLGPRLAAVLGRPLLAGAVRVTPTSVVLSRGAGLHLHTVVPSDAFVATLQPGVRGVDASADGPRTGVDPEVTAVDLALPVTSADALVERVLDPDAATIDLAEAHRIVGGGAGLDRAERFGTLAAIGAAIGASTGATRVITDRGWVGHERQIGTTGVVVDPELYVAFGISGAVQHTSGLGHPRHIVSVNTDPHCPMMQLADLAVVADANAVLDELAGLLAAEPGGERG